MRASSRAMVQILGSGGSAARRTGRFAGGAAVARSASDASDRFNRASASRTAVTTTFVEIKILRRIRAESSRRPPRHRRDACSSGDAPELGASAKALGAASIAIVMGALRRHCTRGCAPDLVE